MPAFFHVHTGPETGEWIFAEAKGKDRLLDTQRLWFSICRTTIPGADIRVYRGQIQDLWVPEFSCRSKFKIFAFLNSAAAPDSRSGTTL